MAALGVALCCCYLIRTLPERSTPETAELAAPAPMAEPAEETPVPFVADILAPAGSEEEREASFSATMAESAVETTISSAQSIKNETNYAVDPAAMLAEGCALRLPREGAQILIIHTHSSEAYMQAGLDRYSESDSTRTEDKNYNIIRVGDELTRLFTEAGLNVIHDRELYDYPSYTGSYSRSGAAIEQHLKEEPGIAVVIDLHRDALGADDVIYKTVAEESGTCASQVMFVMGTDESGLSHPKWRQNLSLALYLQNAVLAEHPTLMRPIDLVPQRYNEHLTPGSMILEVGSNGNTLQEALAAVRLFADAAAPALLELVSQE